MEIVKAPITGAKGCTSCIPPPTIPEYRLFRFSYYFFFSTFTSPLFEFPSNYGLHQSLTLSGCCECFYPGCIRYYHYYYCCRCYHYYHSPPPPCTGNITYYTIKRRYTHKVHMYGTPYMMYFRFLYVLIHGHLVTIQWTEFFFIIYLFNQWLMPTDFLFSFVFLFSSIIYFIFQIPLYTVFTFLYDEDKRPRITLTVR